MLTYVFSGGIIGVDGYLVTVECSITRGLPSLSIVGLPDTAVKESVIRVESATHNSGLEFPEAEIVVNLAPADRKKEGSALDAAILTAILCAGGVIPQNSELGDYCITEAGFGSDLGAEKFFDIKCRFAGLSPDCVVLVATIRALKYNGGVAKTDLAEENVEALKKGIINLKTHIENMRKFGVPVVVAINRFHTDSEAEIAFIEEFCKEMNVDFSLCEVFAKGGEGGKELAEKVCRTIETTESHFAPIYDEKLPIKEKIETIAREIYRADGVNYTAKAEKAIAEIEKLGFDKIPVCVAKTQYSLSDDPTKLGKPENFRITVKDVNLSSGAGFIVALTGDIMTMPGLGKSPAALRIDCDNNGHISGLF